MKILSMTWRHYLAAPLLATPLLSLPCSAQSPGGQAVLAVADSLPINDVQGVVVFRSEPTGRHIVLVPPSKLTPEVVGGMLALVRRLAEKHRRDAVSVVVPVSGVGENRPMSIARRARLMQYIRDVRASARTSLGDAGTGRWILLPSSELALE